MSLLMLKFERTSWIRNSVGGREGLVVAVVGGKGKGALTGGFV